MKRKLAKMTAIAALVTAALIVGCKKDNYVGIVGVCPLVVSTDPVEGATLVPIDKIITVTFNEEMDPATINTVSFTLVEAVPVSGTVSYAGRIASFTPSSPLTPNTTYAGRITSSVKDLNGNFLQTDYTWTFSTGISVSPMIIATDPAHNTPLVFLNKKVTATFNTSMDPLTLTLATFYLKEGANTVGGTVSYNGTTATFAPTGNLLTNTTYTATVTTGAKNVAGTPLANDSVWTFTTGTTAAPYVVSTDPVNQETGVAFNKVIRATFSEAMNPLKITTATFLVKAGTVSVAGTVNYSGSTATFTPASNLLSGTVYTATLTTGAENLTGIPLANNYVWNFSTISPLGPLAVDLKSVSRFGIIAGVGVSNAAGFSEIHNMDVGISPGVRSSITGFPPAVIVNGAMYASNDIAPPGVPAMLTKAKQDLVDAYLFAEGATAPAPATVSGDQGGKTLAPGIYKSTSTLLIQLGDLTLDAQGDVNAVWIFQIASDFTTVGGAGGNVILANGAQAKNVFWQTGSSATLGDGTSFKGNILALTSITMNAYSTAVGRMLARNGSVVMTSTNIINKP